ncbi:MAG: ATP-binding cassette domain-containing protein [Lachnospiraceae bacterium]|nr:ATP-binding cassette domain-containing protein [Lachnospiraceae bacterium]
MITLHNVSKRIKGQEILQNISIEMEEGKCYGFIGNNGCGKTMLLRAVCGYMNIDSGTITINDKQIGRDIDFIRNAGIIIGETQFINSMSGFDNLKILAEIQKKIGDKEIYDVLKQMGLYENRDKKVRKYSLGMKQRLRLAQAFMENPDILVLDEPFNALDKDTVVDVQKKIENEKNKGKTILLTSHDERNISILCDTVFEMDCGRIIGKEICG